MRTVAVTVLLAFQPAAAQPPSLLVVAPKAWSEVLGPFIEHKRAAVNAELLPLEEALAGEGADDPERLKRAIYARWKSRPGLAYVLLAGDADTLPVRYMVLDRCTKEAFNFAFYPSDLYYADLAKADGAFEDWNGEREGYHAGYYGEVRGECTKDSAINFDRVDYRPEVGVGRWPVSSVEQLKVVIGKTIAYERSLEAERGAGGSRRRAVLLAVDGWIDNRPLMERLAARLAPAGWEVTRLYAPASKDDREFPPPDEAHAVEAMNAGAGLVLHSGHGGDDLWAHSLSVASLAKLRNAARPTIVFSAGCSTARFATLPPYEAYVDVRGLEHAGTNAGEVFTEPPPPPGAYQRGPHNPTGLGERLVAGGGEGAVAYIGCNTGSQPCGMTLMAGFVDAAAGPAGGRLGDCWRGAVRYYYEQERLGELKPDEGWYPPSVFFQGMKFMVFGDPSIPMP